MNQVAADLRGADHLLSDESHWVKRSNTMVSPDGKVCYCLSGALAKHIGALAGYEKYSRYCVANYVLGLAVIKETERLKLPKSGVIAFNDSSFTSFADIKRVLAEAIRLAESVT